MKLTDTKTLTGTIEVITGLHIGGSKSSLDIGGLDSPVIKTPGGVPYIPGSSLKGKIRALLALKAGKPENKTKIEDEPELYKKMFGYSGTGSDKKDRYKTRLIFRDAYLDENHFKKEFEDSVLETEFTEAKYENTIDRTTGQTRDGGLRQMERVPVGARFIFEIVLHAYDDDSMEEMLNTLQAGLQLLEKDYLGGSGTRGYGQVRFTHNVV